VSFSNPDAYNLYFLRASTSNFNIITIAPYNFGSTFRSHATIGMSLPERLQLRTWHILPDGSFDSGLTSDVVISVTRNGSPLLSTTQIFEDPDANDRIIDLTALLFSKGDRLGIRIEKTTAVNPGSDRNNYNFIITGIFVRSD